MTANDHDRSYATFLESWPEYRETVALDDLRARDYARLDATGHVYLDYTGGSLYAASQVRAHTALLDAHVFGNPHSANLASTASTTLVERARGAVLEWFDADPAVYTVVFTANASCAIKLVGEAFPFAPGPSLLLAYDNHNSVNGLREYARGRGGTVEYAPLSMPELRIDREALLARLDAPGPGPRLFAYPAQSNFSGVMHPLELVEAARSRGWSVLLDAAAYAPTNRLSLRQTPADFVPVSFYKMFGYPTGVGCLLVRLESLARLHRPWFAGGTVNFATVHAQAHLLSPREAGYEDGTVNYLGIPARRNRPCTPRWRRTRPREAPHPLPHGLDARAARGPAPPQRRARLPHLRAHHDNRSRRHHHLQPLRPVRPPAGLQAHRGTGQRRAHLPAYGLLLQSRRRGDRRRHHRR